jgi:hypothetical protein
VIDAMFQAGTDAVLDDQLQRPRAPVPQQPGFSLTDLLKAPAQGVGGGAAKSIAFASDILGAFGQVGGAYPETMGVMTQTDAQRREADAARAKLVKQGLDFSSAAGDIFRQRAADILPDPLTAHASAQIVAGLFDFGAQALGYVGVAGPFVGGALLAGDVGMAEADRLKQAGVDEATRTKAGAAAAVLAGGSVAVPLSGVSALSRFAKGAAVGEGAIIGQSLAERAILRSAGYDKIADGFDPFDPVALALGIVPGVLGAKFGKPPARLQQVATEAQVRDAARLTPAEQARSDAFEASAGNLRELEQAVAAEKNPANRAILQAELDKQRAAAASGVAERYVRDMPDAVPAARVKQAADALDASRLSADSDLAGMRAHLQAVELASDQMARGERVDVTAAQPVHESRQLLQAWDEVHGNPIGPADDPLVRLVPDDVDAVQVERGPATLTGDGLTVRAGGYGIVKFIWKHGPESSKDPAVQVTRADLAALPYIMREFEPEVKSVRGIDQLTWTVDRPDGQRVLYGTTRFVQDGEHHLVTVHVDEAKATPPSLPREKPPQSFGREALQASKSGTAGESFSSSSPEVMQGQGAILPSDLDAPAPAGASLRAAQDVAALHPDMLVQLDGMDAPMRVGDLLEAVKREAAHEAQTARLVEVAAACALRT